ncbi:MAG: type IV pilus modification PilV family protein [Ruminiclostridium sp.]
MKNKNITFKNEKGTTLVEIILSVALLAIIAAPLLGAVVSSVKNNSAAKDKTEAMALAEEIIGEIKAWRTIGTTPFPAGTQVPYTIPTSGNLKPYYEIVSAGDGNVTENMETAYNYGIPNADSYDFEIRIDQGTFNTDKILSSITFYKKGSDGNNIDLKSLQKFSIADSYLELNVEHSTNLYSIVKKTTTVAGTVTEKVISTEQLYPKDSIIRLKVTYENTEPSSDEQLKILTKVLPNDSDDNFFKVYFINNEEANSGVKFINKGTTNFEVNYMDANVFKYAGEPLNQLFKIIITIEKNDKPIYETSSYVKK